MNAKRTILLADDAAMFRELGSVFLARTGRVVTANNGHEGLGKDWSTVTHEEFTGQNLIVDGGWTAQ